MKKFFKSFALAFLLINLALTFSSIAQAADSELPKPEGYNPIETLQTIGDPTSLPSFYETGVHPDAPNNYTEPGVTTVTSPILFALDLFRYIVSGIAMLVIVVAALKLVSTANDEQAEKMRQNLVAGVIGLSAMKSLPGRVLW